MDVFVLVMGLTLFTAGWFIFWDYVRFLYSSYSVKGRVVSFTSPYLLGGSSRKAQTCVIGYVPHYRVLVGWSANPLYLP